jgi:short-subunit dehydrogenase
VIADFSNLEDINKLLESIKQLDKIEFLINNA